MAPFAFRYTKLPNRHIRLLRLLPGGTGDELKCQIEICSLDDDPKYEAISYVWGATTPIVYLSCGTRIVQISPSLESALCRLRKKRAIRILWADQVCINQSNNAERSVQVRIMAEIFRKARCVIAWLGADNHGEAALAKDLIDRLAERRLHGADSLPDNRPINDQLLREHDLPLTGDARWGALVTFTELPYFQRVWTYHEFKNASQVQLLWGATLFKRDAVEKAVLCLCFYKPQELPRSPSRSILLDYVGRTFFTVTKAFAQNIGTLFDLMVLMSFRTASDERDKLFSSLDMLKTVPHGIEIDYSKPLVDVFVTVSQVIILESKSLSVLQYAGLENLAVHSEDATWPSWVPVWRKTLMQKTSFVNVSRHGMAPSADGGAEMDFKSLRFESHILSSSGVKVGEVKHISPQHAGPDVEFLLQIADTWTHCVEFSSLNRTRTNKPLVLSFLRTMLPPKKDLPGVQSQAERSDSDEAFLFGFVMCWWGLLIERFSSLGKQLQGLEEVKPLIELCDAAILAAVTLLDGVNVSSSPSDGLIQSAKARIMTLAEDEMSPDELTIRQKYIDEEFPCIWPDAEDCAKAIRAVRPYFFVPGNGPSAWLEPYFWDISYKRAFLITTAGDISLGPTGTQPGDVIAILFGSPILQVLRPARDGCYRLVGECYIERIMQGEHIQALRESGRMEEETEVFRLV